MSVYLDYDPADDVEPHCDLCGLHMEAWAPHRVYDDNDWNGETGNHLSCEDFDKWKKSGNSGARITEELG